jgi:hypothetical protein
VFFEGILHRALKQFTNVICYVLGERVKIYIKIQGVSKRALQL